MSIFGSSIMFQITAPPNILIPKAVKMYMMINIITCLRG